MNIVGIKKINKTKIKIELKMNIKKMLKLPEAPDRKRGGASTKKELSRQKKEAHALFAVTSGATTPRSFLLLAEGTMHPSLDDALANQLVAVVYFTKDPWLKIQNNGLIKITTEKKLKLKIPNNGHNSPKASNTLLTPWTPNLDIYTQERFTYFNTLTGRRNHFICIQEEFPLLLNGCWIQK